ncbi:MAG: hypothetical protein GY847_14615 [Proteobacteria bacterium]|nr:hypothetical protein [Pseudomonadota bacterium]
MKWIAKPLLWIFTSALPVFIAACYGVYQEEGYWDTDSDSGSYIGGRVVDKTSGNGIYDIQVDCIEASSDTDSGADTGTDSGANEEIVSTTYTMENDGAFMLQEDIDDCDFLQFKDVDGEENGGLYKSRRLALEYGKTTTIMVQLELEE